MAYKVLYRKYRPDSFDKIIGQNNIVNALKNSVANNTFAHAYIFTGPRGTGKTSTAKILAKAINCVKPNNGEPCCQCENCLNFNTSPDIIEIDAASNNGVDEIRELRTNITLAPSMSKYKIYIIDEVHMLSTGAFNALLKTLEEPPAHVIFILATTEIYKVPITILSRCQRFDFKKVNKAEMEKHLANICKLENIKYEEEALEEIYQLSDGCLRDSLSILDQLTKLDKELKLETVLENYNIISNKIIDKLLCHTVTNDIEEVIKIISDFEDSGMNVQKLLKKFINYLNQMALNTKLKTETRFDFHQLSSLIKELNQIYVDARINENSFELIKLAFLDNMSVTAEPKRTIKSENKVKKLQTISNDIKEEVKTKPNMDLVDIRVNNCFVEANKNELNNVVELWNNNSKKLNGIEANNYFPVAASNKYVIFKTEEKSLQELFNIKHEEIEEILKTMSLDRKVVSVTASNWEKIKTQYINNLKEKIKYKYIEEPQKVDKNNIIKKEMEDIFNDSLIEIS